MKCLSLLLSKHILLIFSFVIPSHSFAHTGGQDANGGHVNRSTGEYHCHKPDCVLPVISGSAAGYIDVVSFNIQFLGNFKNRDNEALAALMTPYDVVVVQELVAPPFAGKFPDSTNYKPDIEAQQFFDVMTAKEFDFILSEEDTGSNDKIHINSAATEWWIVFYKPDAVEPATDLPNGYLASDRSNYTVYERVPFNMGSGFQLGNDEANSFHAWAVYQGGVSAVPVPPAVWLFGSGLMDLLEERERNIIYTAVLNKGGLNSLAIISV
ncbi:MAG: YHYH domain-containing protein [Woeseiaceae bacterium]